MMVRIFDKMKTERKKLILLEADKFIKKNTIS
jgi:deoxyribodipyrimidine photolyase-related protein